MSLIRYSFKVRDALKWIEYIKLPPTPIKCPAVDTLCSGFRFFASSPVVNGQWTILTLLVPSLVKPVRAL